MSKRFGEASIGWESTWIRLTDPTPGMIQETKTRADFIDYETQQLRGNRWRRKGTATNIHRMLDDALGAFFGRNGAFLSYSKMGAIKKI